MNGLASYFWIAVAAILLLIDLWAIVSVFRSDKTDAVKAAWALLIVALPLVGLGIWGVLAREASSEALGPLPTSTAKADIPGPTYRGLHNGRSSDRYEIR